MPGNIRIEKKVPATHPLRKLRAVVDALLPAMNSEFETVYARHFHPYLLREMLLKPILLKFLFSVRCERPLAESVNYNLLYSWFGSLNTGNKVRDHSTISANGDRLFNEYLAAIS